MQNKLMRHTLIYFFIFSLLTFISITFIDKPLSLWLYSSGINNLAANLHFRYITENLIPILPYACIILVLFIRPQINIGNKWAYLIYLYVILQISLFIKILLKDFFGRYWPLTWINDNLSLIHDGKYGFNWLHGFGNQGCFPSGHTTYIAILAFSLSIAYPRFQKLFYSIIIIMVFALICQNYHFLGDCLAAIALSILLANLGFIVYIWLYEKCLYQLTRHRSSNS